MPEVKEDTQGWEETGYSHKKSKVTPVGTLGYVASTYEEGKMDGVLGTDHVGAGGRDSTTALK